MPTNQEIHDQQKQIWNGAAPGWKKWDPLLMTQWKAVSEAMLQAAHLKEGHQVLEMACGTGEPGIPAAKRVGKGSVIGTDLAEDMMVVAMEKAKAQGVSNYKTRPASALSLPFQDAQFDAVLCRWGIMFFPDPAACLKETLRVMKPGAYVSFATWNSQEHNPHVGIPLGVAVQKLGFTPPAPDSPGVLRYADPKKLAGLMTEAGFQDVTIQDCRDGMEYESLDQYWDFVSEVVGPFKAGLQKADVTLREVVKAEVYEKARTLMKDGKVRMTYSSWIVTGRKP